MIKLAKFQELTFRSLLKSAFSLEWFLSIPEEIHIGSVLDSATFWDCDRFFRFIYITFYP